MHLTSQSNACSIDELTMMMPFGPDIFISRDHHELGVARTPEDGVVRTLKSHHLEGEGLLAEVARRAEPDR
jgi:hypothetical protein